MSQRSASHRLRSGSTGVSTSALLVGKTIAYLSLYLLHLVFYLVIVYYVFGFPSRGSLALAVVFLVPFFIAVILV